MANDILLKPSYFDSDMEWSNLFIGHQCTHSLNYRRLAPPLTAPPDQIMYVQTLSSGSANNFLSAVNTLRWKLTWKDPWSSSVPIIINYTKRLAYLSTATRNRFKSHLIPPQQRNFKKDRATENDTKNKTTRKLYNYNIKDLSLPAMPYQCQCQSSPPAPCFCLIIKIIDPSPCVVLVCSSLGSWI